MPLTKNDLKQIRTVVQEEVSGSETRIKKFVKGTVNEEVNSLAIMTKHGFDAVDKRFDQIDEQMLIHDFKMTEMVHKSDHSILKERVDRLEKKAGLRR